MRIASIFILACSLTLAAACGGSSKPAAPSDATSDSSGVIVVNSIDIALTSAGCDPLSLNLPAGPTTFKLSNQGDTSTVNEFEVLDGPTLLGEAESIVPGIDHSFSLTLQPGRYTTYCPGGSQDEYGTLVVTSDTAGGSSTTTTLTALQSQAVDTYRSYLQEQTARLVAATKPLVDAVVAGDINAAKQLYPAARAPYERIEPVAETFRELDPDIDSRENDVADGQEWTGFHRLEKALWQDDSLDGMVPIARKLYSDVATLQSLVVQVSLEPATIANGAVELLNEISSSKITGEEERYSHLDLLDFAANLEGSQQAYEVVQPLVAQHDEALSQSITQRFAAARDELLHYQTPSGFVDYTQLTSDDTRRLSVAIDALAELVSQVARQVIS